MRIQCLVPHSEHAACMPASESYSRGTVGYKILVSDLDYIWCGTASWTYSARIPVPSVAANANKFFICGQLEF